MKTTIVKLDIVIDIINNIRSSSYLDEPVPELMDELHKDVDSIVQSEGFTRKLNLSNNLSRRNGGWAYYDTYTLFEGESKITLIIDVRTADHPSKPNLETKNVKRLDILKRVYEGENAAHEVIDTYYHERDWGVQYYIGKGNRYSDPADSIDKFNIMLKGQLNKIKNKYS